MLIDDERLQKKKQMLKECYSLFVKQGLENTSISDLAKHCKTYKAALYNFFSSKDEIVLESAKLYMHSLDEKIQEKFKNPQLTLSATMKDGFEMLSNEKNNLRYVYQVVSSPKYGEQSRKALSEIYTTYFNYSETLANMYGVSHELFRPYFLMFISIVHDFCLWENNELINEKLQYIYSQIESL